MTVHVFFNPELVVQLTASGIIGRPGRPPAPSRGFVLGNDRPPRAQGGRTVTHVIDSRAHVTITGPRRLPVGRPAVSSATASEPRNALALVEECEGLRRDNQRLSNEVTQLREEVTRLTTGPRSLRLREGATLDDTVLRFALLELE